jgi:outer membrane protein insertion porin family
LPRTRVIVAAAAGALLVALVAVHAAPVRALVLRRVRAAVRTSSGIDLRAGSLFYNILTLSAELQRVELASVGTPTEPFATAEALGVTFGVRTLIGDITLRRISLAAPSINIRRYDDGTDNLPRVTGAQAAGEGFVLPPIAVDNLGVSFRQAGVSAVISGASVRLTSAESGGFSAVIDVQRGVRMTLGERTIDLTTMAGTFAVAGQQLEIRDLTVARPGTTVRANGRVALRGAASTVDVSLRGSSEIETWWAEFSDAAGPAGHVEGTAQVTGLLSDPTITFDTDGRSLEWSDVQISRLHVNGGYGSGQLSLNTLTLNVAGGTVDGRGTIALGATSRPSRVDARWTEIDARQILPAGRFAGALSKSGTAIIEWRRAADSAARVFGINATTGITAAGRTTGLEVRGSGQADRWHVEVASRDSGAAQIRAAADIRLDSRRWEGSAIEGRVVMRTTELPAAIRQAQAFGAAANIDPATAAGDVDVDAMLSGTLAAVRSTGRITGRSVTLAGLPASDFDTSFALDVAGRTSTGTFRLMTPELSSATLAARTGVALGGSLTATGSWSGPLSAPVVDASASGRNLTAARGGSVAVIATGVALEATMNGPIGDLRGDGRVTIGSAQIGGRRAGAVTADLSLTGGIVRVGARAPDLHAALNASIGLESPNTFEGQGTVDDYDIRALGELMGLALDDASALSGMISSSFSFTGDLQNPASLAVDLAVAPLDARVFDVAIVLDRGLRATMTRGRLQFEDRTMTFGGVAVRAGGGFATDRAEGRLVVDLDGDIGTLQPWLRRIDTRRELAAAGPITGRVELERLPAGITVTGNLKAEVSTLASRDKTLAQDVGIAIEFTGQRAEVREIGAAMLGGRLRATGGAPLIWLNDWLPAAWQVAPPETAMPATLEGTASFDVPALLELVGRPPLEAFGGDVDLSARLTASRPDLMAIEGDVRLERAQVTARDQTYVQSDVTRFRLAEGALLIESLDWRGPGSTVIGGGRVGIAKGVESDVRLDVDTDLGIIGTLVSGRATGRLDGSIELHGPAGASRVAAEASLKDASWLVPGQRILFAGWSGQVRLTDDDLSLTDLGGTVNGGTVRIDGQLPLRAQGAGGGLTIVARDILIDVPRGLHSQIGADLVWRQSETEATRLLGRVEVTANRYTEPVTRILQLVNSLAAASRRSGESALPPWLSSTALEVDVIVTDPIVIDNSVGVVELIPDLQLGGTVDSPSLSGRIDVIDDGRVQLGGRAYRLRDSLLRFAPADGVVPTLDVLGDTRIGDYEVTVRISGTPARIETAFSSVPPLGERELQALIVTGRADDQSTQGNQSDNFAAAATATDILGFAGKFVGLDSVRIGAADLDLVSKDVNTAQHLTVQKSLGSSFDLIFSDNLEDGSVTWVLVWKPTPINEIRASSFEDGRRALEVRRSLVFGPGSPAGVRGGSRLVAEQPRAIVDAVQITGTPGFTNAEVADQLELDRGNRFDVRRWIEDRRRLEAFYLDRGYHRVRIVPTRREDASRTLVSLAYDIARGPQTVIQTNGDSLPGEALDAMYEAWRGLPIADVVRTEFERIAREDLARRGYYRPTVKVDFLPETPELARVTIDVARGVQTRQLFVAWTGNRDVPAAELDTLLVPHRAESAVWLDAQAIALEVQQLYASRGHLQAEVTVGEPLFQNADATLPIAIDEGVLSRLVNVRIAGVDPARMTGAEQALGLPIGEPFAASAPVDATRRLKNYYLELGYRNADVSYDVTTSSTGSVSIAWAVKEGPVHIVKDVNVSGAETTNAGLVQNAVTLEPGAVVSQGAVDTTRRNLYDIGSFRRVDFDFGNPATSASDVRELPLTLGIQVEEPQRFQVRYGLQFTFDRSAGKSFGNAFGGSVELRDRNFIGRAVQASVGAHWDPDLRTLGLLFSSPRLLGKRVRTNVYVRARREQTVVDGSAFDDPAFDGSAIDGATLDDRRRDLTFEQRTRAPGEVELVWGYNVASRVFRLNQNDQQADSGGLLAGPVFSIIFDKRDSPFDATRGLFHSSSFQFGVEKLGSDLNYFRYLLRQSYYQPLGKLTATGSVRFGTIHGFSGTTPVSVLDVLFQAGGTNSVRGYPEESLSAFNVAGFALGGTELLVLNGEVRFPIRKLLSGAAFVDAGNTFASAADIVLGKLAVGAGLGVRVRTPLAPLRLDVAYPFNAPNGQSGVRVHFSIGQMF